METVAAPLSPRNAGPLPALYLTLCLHLAAVAARLRSIGFHGTLSPAWRLTGRAFVCFVAIEVDPQSDTLIADQWKALRECREILIGAGFVVGGDASAEPRPLRVTSYHGGAVYADDPARCPECTAGACLRHDVLFSELREPAETPVSRRIVVQEAA